MGLRCSVLGHRYGERERIEERDDQGSEVVVATREVKTCDRCGEELVISESKEITSTQEPEPEPEPPEQPVTDHQSDTPDSNPEPDIESEPDDGIILSDTPTDRDPGEWPDDPDPDEDEEIEEAEWPEVEEAESEPVEADESTESPSEEWPDSEGDDEGFDAIAGDVEDDLADEVIDVVTQEAASTGEAEETGAGFVRAGPIDSPADPQDAEVHTEYYCPQCSWNARSLTTSVRRGDICPSCRTGYVAEREP